MGKKVLSEGDGIKGSDFFDKMQKTINERGLQLRTIPLNRVKIIKNVRQAYKGIEDMAQSIKEKGLLQPITVTPTEDGFYEIVFGHRRYKGYCFLNEKSTDKYTRINAIIKDKEQFDEGEIKEVQLIENIQREDISTLELKEALEYLKSTGLSHEDIAHKISKSVGYVKNAFMSIKTLKDNPELEELVKSHAGVTFADLQEVKVIPFKFQIDLIQEKLKGTIKTREELRERVREIRDKLYSTNHDTHIKKKTFDVFSNNNGRIKVRSFIYDPKNSSRADTVKLLTSLKGLVKTLEEAAQ